jgi:hypothetical protein
MMTNCQLMMGKYLMLPWSGYVNRTVSLGRRVTTNILVKLTIASSEYFWKIWLMLSRLRFTDEERDVLLAIWFWLLLLLNLSMML